MKQFLNVLPSSKGLFVHRIYLVGFVLVSLVPRLFAASEPSVSEPFASGSSASGPSDLSSLVIAQERNLPAYTTQNFLSLVQGLGTKKLQAEEEEPNFRSDRRYVPKYEAGQGGVGLGGGVIFPLYFQSLDGTFYETNLSVGGAVWFEWDIFLWKALSTGMEIGGMFTLTPNERTLFLAPITAHIKYTFQVFPVEFPISMGAGFSMSSLENSFKIDFAVKPKVGALYRINQNWAAGVYSSYWFILQSYANTNLSSDFSMLGNFIDVTLGFTYVF